MPPPPDRGGRSVDVPRPDKQAYLVHAFKAPAVADPDAAATDLFTYILGDSPSSRLSVVVRDRLALVSAVEAGYVTRQRGGLVTVTARLQAENPHPAVAAMPPADPPLQHDGGREGERPPATRTAAADH